MSLDIKLVDNGCVVFERNITHNLARMAVVAGLHKPMWRPEEIGARKASDICGLLRGGLIELTQNPGKFKVFNPKNGWGTYDTLVDAVTEYYKACVNNPEAEIEVSR